MQFFVDLRYVFPPIVNLILLLLASENGSLYFLINNATNFDQYPLLKLAFLVIALLLFVVFLLTLIKLPLTAHPVTVRAGYFSGPLIFSLLASVFFPPPLFWIAFLVIIITSPWHSTLWNTQKRIFIRFCQTLQSIPSLVISCTQQRDDPEAAPRPLADEFADIEGNTLQLNQPSLEQDLVVVIDG